MPASSRPTVQAFVEGPDDCFVAIHTVLALRPSFDRNAKNWISITPSGNDATALSNFALASKGSGPGRIGLIIDADDQPGKRVADRWQAISEAVAGVVTSPPGALPPATGFIGQTIHGLRIGAWIMPDNVRDGALETFIALMVPPADLSWPFALTAAQGAKVTYGASYPATQEPKAHLHTWLAWRTEPGRPYGRAIECGDLDANQSGTALVFTKWFEDLFVGP